MQLTKQTDLSLRVMIHLAIIQPNQATIKDISEKYKVSRNHLMKVVNKLVTHELIGATQGRGGGIRLINSPESIRVGDVVRVMESTDDLIDCAGSGCPITPACKLKHVLKESTQAFLAVLDGYTIKDITENKSVLIQLISH